MKSKLKFLVYQFLYLVYLYRKIFSGHKRLSTSDQKILIVETALLGDVVTTTPALERLGLTFPKAKIWMAIQGRYKALVSGNPSLAGVISLDYTNVWGVARLIRQVRRQGFHLVVASSPGLRNASIALLGGQDCIVGYLTNRSWRAFFFQNHWVEATGIEGRWQYLCHEHLTIRALKALLPLGIRAASLKEQTRLFVPPDIEASQKSLLVKKGFLQTDTLTLVFHPCASWLYKQWPSENMSSLLSRLAESFGHRVNLVVVGIPAEESTLTQIRAKSPAEVKYLVGDELEPLLVLIKNCDIFVGNDSGPKHIADAFKKPLVEILGPSLPETIGAANKNAVTLYSKVACSPCTQQQCNKDRVCMRSITVDDVFGAIAKMIRANQKFAPPQN